MAMQALETYPNTQRAATRQTRRVLTLRPILKEMMDNISNPHSMVDRDIVKKQFLEFMNSPKGAQFRETAYTYWLDNNYRSLLADYPSDPVQRAQQKAAAAEARGKTVTELTQVIHRAVKAKAQAILLDIVLPNGKALRDATGKDCAKAGGWLSKIAAKVKPSEKVGDVLSEAQVKKLFSGS